MKNLLHNNLIELPQDTYLKLLIILAPLLNFLNGITFDLYTPSMPAIAHYYDASFTAVKNTVTATMLGFSLGSLIFGILLDVFGRRRVILLGLFFYVITSFLAIYCQTIEQLIIIRFIQGMLVAVVSVGARAIVIDTFSGHQFTIAILYISLGFSLGPIIGPFIGGILQDYFDWQANFLAYVVMGILLLLIFMCYVKESLQQRHSFSLKKIYANYTIVLSNSVFIAGIFLIGATNLELMLYSTIGAFIVESKLHYSATTYGNTALLVGCCYLMGSLTNRFFIKNLHLHHLTRAGFIILVIGLIVQLIIALLAPLNLITLIIPIMIICYSQGFIAPNVMAHSLKIFPQHGGVASSLIICGSMVIAALGMLIISHISVNHLLTLAAVFAVIIILQTAIFYLYFKPEIKIIN